MSLENTSVFNFSETRLALLYQEDVLVIRRHNNPRLPFTEKLDVIVGTREGH